MFRTINSLIGYSVLATDGEMGRVDDLLFDERSWSTAYLVVDIGGLNGRSVLLPPTAIGRPDSERKRFPVAYSRQQVTDSPGIDLDRPVSRQQGRHVYKYYGSSPRWIPSSVQATGTMSQAYPTPESGFDEDDPHLLSAREVMHYGVHAIDGMIGDLEDLVADDTTWGICYLTVDTGDRLAERRVLVSPLLVKRISWMEEMVYVDLTLEMLRRNPKYNTSLWGTSENRSLRLLWQGRKADLQNDRSSAL